MSFQQIDPTQVKFFPKSRPQPTESRGDAALRERGFRRFGETSSDNYPTPTSDNYKLSDPLNLNPQTEPVGPAPPDAEALYKSHQEHLKSYNQCDPNSLVFKRPDLEAEYKKRAELDFKAVCIRAGIHPPAPLTPERLAMEQHEERWKTQMPETLKADLDGRIAATKEMSKEAREAAIVAMQRDMGEREYHHRADFGHPPLDKAAFVRAEGERQFEELAKQARLARHDLPDHALSDPYVVKTLAAFGRYSAAEQALRPKLK